MIWLIGLSIFILVWIILHRVKHNSWEEYPPKYVPIRLPVWGYIIIFVISMMPVVNIMLFIIFLIGLVAVACEQEVQIKWLDPIFKFLSKRY